MGNSETGVAGATVAGSRPLAGPERLAAAQRMSVLELINAQAENDKLRRQLAAARMILRARGQELPEAGDADKNGGDDDELEDLGPDVARYIVEGAADSLRAFRGLANDWTNGVDFLRLDVSVPLVLGPDRQQLSADAESIFSRVLVIPRGTIGLMLTGLHAALEEVAAVLGAVRPDRGVTPAYKPTTPPQAGAGEDEAAEAEEEAVAMLHPGGRAVLEFARRRAETHFKGRLPLILTLSTFGGEVAPSELPSDLIRFDTLSIRPDALARAIHGLQELALELDPEAYNCDDLMLDDAASRLARQLEADAGADDGGNGDGATDAT